MANGAEGATVAKKFNGMSARKFSRKYGARFEQALGHEGDITNGVFRSVMRQVAFNPRTA